MSASKPPPPPPSTWFVRHDCHTIRRPCASVRDDPNMPQWTHQQVHLYTNTDSNTKNIPRTCIAFAQPSHQKLNILFYNSKMPYHLLAFYIGRHRGTHAPQWCTLTCVYTMAYITLTLTICISHNTPTLAPPMGGVWPNGQYTWLIHK